MKYLIAIAVVLFSSISAFCEDSCDEYLKNAQVIIQLYKQKLADTNDQVIGLQTAMLKMQEQLKKYEVNVSSK